MGELDKMQESGNAKSYNGSFNQRRGWSSLTNFVRFSLIKLRLR